jgi:hypothetical protein
LISSEFIIEVLTEFKVKFRVIASDVGDICRLHQAPEYACTGMAVMQETSFRSLEFNRRC